MVRKRKTRVYERWSGVMQMNIVTCVNSGCRWPRSGIALAFSTLGGQFVGPGPIRVFIGKFMGLSRHSGGSVGFGVVVILR